MAEDEPRKARPRASLHPAFVLLAVVALLAGRGTELAAIFGSVLVHELAHLGVAALWDLRARRITLYPFGGVADLPGLGTAPPAARLAILSAGPLASLAVLLGAAAWLAGGEGTPPGWLRVLERANLGILAANLLPVGPLDGGRILEVALERALGIGAARRFLLGAGVWVGVGLAAAGSAVAATGGPGGSLILFGLFLAVASHRERAATSFAVLAWCLRGPRPCGVGPARVLVAPPGGRAREVAARLGPGPYRLVAVVGPGGRVCGLLGEGEIAAAMNRGGAERTLAALLEDAGTGGECGPGPRSGREPSGSGGEAGGGRTEEPL